MLTRKLEYNTITEDIKMSEDIINVEQKSALGSNTTNIGVQNNGLTVSEATHMAFAIFREYYPQLKEEALQELRKSVEEKLSFIPQENIIPPTPRIAVPTLQNASITEEIEIRELYATLLANSMNSIVKKGVHPGFVEIIKQLSPDEAKILKLICYWKIVPIVALRYESDNGNGFYVVKCFSNIGELSHCEYPMEISKYFDNLYRLGLIERITDAHLVDQSLYEPLKNHQYIKSLFEKASTRQDEYVNAKFEEGFVQITDYGEEFCKNCIVTRQVTSINKR